MRRSARRLLPPLIPWLIACAGCGEADRPEPAAISSHDPELAGKALGAALDAWRHGKAGSLGKRVPPIRFVDDDKVAGFRLVDYRPSEAAASPGLHQDVAVELILRDPRGREVRRTARYQVATTPQLAVLRSDD